MCVRSQHYQILVDTEDNSQERGIFAKCVETLEEVLEEGNDPNKPIVSFHAMLGTENSHTMILKGKVRNTSMVIFVTPRPEGRHMATPAYP